MIIFYNGEYIISVKSLNITKTQASLEREARRGQWEDLRSIPREARGQSGSLWKWLILSQEETVNCNCPIEIVPLGRAGSFGSLWINLTWVDVLFFYSQAVDPDHLREEVAAGPL